MHLIKQREYKAVSVSESASEWVSERASKWASEWASERASAWASEWVSRDEPGRPAARGLGAASAGRSARAARAARRAAPRCAWARARRTGTAPPRRWSGCSCAPAGCTPPACTHHAPPRYTLTPRSERLNVFWTADSFVRSGLRIEPSWRSRPIMWLRSWLRANLTCLVYQTQLCV